MSEQVELHDRRLVLVRYGELALKGENRSDFERKLARNVLLACRPIAPVRVERGDSRMLVWPSSRIEAVAQRIQEVFGISSLSPAWSVEPTFPAIVERATAVLDEAVAAHPADGAIAFRVRSTRADKAFPMTSPQLDRELGGVALARHPRLKVDLDHAAIELGVDVRRAQAFVFARRLAGAGGLPVGTLGRALCLISGGIDSPVAAYLAMKRGLELAYCTFHSHPYIGDNARKKVIDLVRVLARRQPRRSRVWVVPFAQAQVAIKGAGFEAYRTVLYRRMMQRIASELAQREEAGALITGESLGQVASQTLENLTCIADAAALPVLRPLVSFDKDETVTLARRIGTFELSAVQEPDCCTLFMPTRPIIRGKIEVCTEAEQRFDVAEQVRDALARAEAVDVEA